MNKLLIIPILMTGCAMLWTTKQFDISRDEAWSCEDNRRGARVKAFFYTERTPSEVELVIKGGERRWEVPLQWEDSMVNAGDLWAVDTQVDGLRCGRDDLRGSIIQSR